MPVASTPVTQKKSFLGRFVKFVLWTLAICLVFEIGLRFFGFGSYVIYKPDQELLWIPMPGANKVTEMNHEPENINSQHFRYREVLSMDHPGIYRVFSFGDSTTMGWGVDDDSTYAAFLGEKLNQDRCPGEQFLSVTAGVNAYPNALVGEKLREVEEDPTFQPDVVIRAYSFNSNFEKLPRLEGAARAKFLRQVEMKSIIRRSAIYNFVIEDLLRRAVYYRMRHLLMSGTLDTLGGMDNLDVNAVNASFQNSLEEAHAHNAQLVLLVFASKD